jgi:hypothetical protein
MKILVVGEDFPWPSNRGGLIRLGKTIEAVSQLGETDLFTLYDPRRTSFPVPEDVSLARLETTLYPEAARQLRWRAAWMARRGMPLELAMRAYDPSPRRSFDAWAKDRYDVVWFDTATTFVWLGRPWLGPSIVDLNNLEDEKARQWANVLRADRRGQGVLSWLRTSAAAAQATKNAHDWHTLQRSVAAKVERVVLCSETDARRSGLPNAVVIPNTYQRPARPVGHEAVGEPPTILLQGTLTYGPNMDAVEWLIGDIAPRLWSRVPRAEIRLVGNPAPSVRRRERPPSVTVVGQVPDMEPELGRADISIVPLRVGSGTRVKILESFAHRVPVVSTTLGAEGLDVRDGVHLLVADDAGGFAAACERLLVDASLRKRLVDAAEDLYLRRYEWSGARDRIQQLIRDVARPHTDAS